MYRVRAAAMHDRSWVMCTALIVVPAGPAINGLSTNAHPAALGVHVPLTQLSVGPQQTVPHACCGGQQLPEIQAKPVGQHGWLPQATAFGPQFWQNAASIGGLSLLQTWVGPQHVTDANEPPSGVKNLQHRVVAEQQVLMDALGFVGKSMQQRSGNAGVHVVAAQLRACTVRGAHNATAAPTMALPIRRRA